MADTEIEQITETDLSTLILIFKHLIKLLIGNLFFVAHV